MKKLKVCHWENRSSIKDEMYLNQTVQQRYDIRVYYHSITTAYCIANIISGM